MKIAIISDIHGNLEALKSTLNDIKTHNVDKIICLGDIILKGSHSEECVRLVRDNCDIVIKGNCDNFFDAKIGKEPKHGIPLELEQKRIDSINDELSEEIKDYLRGLPFSKEFYMSGSLIRLFHAHPEQISKVVVCEDPYERQYQLFLPSNKTESNEIADVVIYGHLHAQFMTKLYNRTLINVGSVGNSFNVIRDEGKDADYMETTASHYLILSGDFESKEYNSNLSFEFIRVNYNIDAEIEKSQDNIEKEALINELKEGKYRNMLKISEKRY